MPLVNNSLGKIFTNSNSGKLTAGNDLRHPTHWSARIKETTIAAPSSAAYLDLPVNGGSDYGQFCFIGYIQGVQLSYWGGPQLQEGDVILEVQGHEVSGYTLIDLKKLIRILSANSEPIVFKTLSSDLLPCPADSLKIFLGMSFPQDSPDYALQNVIKNNLNQRVVPCTTRKKRPEEVDGVDYQFLAPEEFQRREHAGLLLETGIYEGNRYGTPMPSHDSSVFPPSKGDTGASNDDELNHLNKSASSPLNSIPSPPPDPNPHLGPLPPHWEIAYTEDCQPYFINHALGTTQWEDPRALGTDMNGETVEEEDSAMMTSLLASGDRQLCNIPDGSSEEELPPGWEKVVDSKYGVFYIDHINQHTQYERPSLSTGGDNNTALHSQRDTGTPYYPHFTPNPQELRGRLVKTTLLKSARGFGFTIIGGSDRNCPQFLQIKNIVPDGPAAQDGVLGCGDVLVYVNETCVLGYTHSDVVGLFQKISVGEAVSLTACQGYRLPYEPDDPDMQFVTTMAVQSPGEVEQDPLKLSRSSKDGLELDSHEMVLEPHLAAHSSSPLLITTINEAAATSSVSSGSGTANPGLYFMPREQKLEFLKVNIMKSSTGFGFTIADHFQGQRVKQISDPQRCSQLRQGDVLVEINDRRVKELSHSAVVQILKDCPIQTEARLLVQRGGGSFSFPPQVGSNEQSVDSHEQMSNSFYASTNGSFPMTSALTVEAVSSHTNRNSVLLPQSKSMEWLQQRDECFLQSMPGLNEPQSPELYVSTSKIQRYRSKTPGPEWGRADNVTEEQSPLLVSTVNETGGLASDWLRPKTPTAAQMRTLQSGIVASSAAPVSVATAIPSYLQNSFNGGDRGSGGGSGIPDFMPASAWLKKSVNVSQTQGMPQTYGSLPRMTRHRTNKDNGIYQDPTVPSQPSQYESSSRGTMRSRSIPSGDSAAPPLSTGLAMAAANTDVNVVDFTVTLTRMTSGFGFRIIGGAEERSQATVGPLIPGGAAEQSNQMRPGDQIISVDGTTVIGSPHRHVLGLMELAKRVGRVTLGLRRRVSIAAPTAQVPMTGLPSSNPLSSSQSMYQFVSRAPVPIPLYASVSHSRSGALPSTSSQPQQQRVSSKQLSSHASGSVNKPLPSVYDITLHRDVSEGFGFIIATSANSTNSSKSPSSGEYIGRILEGSPAARCGFLRVRDRILAVNNIDISPLSHEEVVRMIKECGQTVTLRIVSSASTSAGSSSNTSRSYATVQTPKYASSSSSKPLLLPPDIHGSNVLDEFAVTLARGSRGFGFSIRGGGKDGGKMPFCVLKIAEEGAAKQDGRLKIGDQILQINGHSTKDMSHEKFIEMIQSAGSTIRLIVRRPPSVHYQHQRNHSATPSNAIYYSMQRPR